MITGMPRIALAVRDFEHCLATFRERLGMPVIDLSDTSVTSLGAKLAMCVPDGGSNIELMSPAAPDSPLSQSLSRFLDRRGQGPFALMLEAPDPDDEAERLTERGLNVLPLMAGAGGRDVHPDSTHGVLIRVYPVSSFQGNAGVSPGEQHSPRLSGVARVLIAVRDLDHAVAVYGEKLGLQVGEPTSDAVRGTRSAICTPPTGGLIELVSVGDRTKPFAKAIGAFLEANREGMYALVLESPDLEATRDSLEARGIVVRAADDSEDALAIDPSATFGASLRVVKASSA